VPTRQSGGATSGRSCAADYPGLAFWALTPDKSPCTINCTGKSRNSRFADVFQPGAPSDTLEEQIARTASRSTGTSSLAQRAPARRPWRDIALFLTMLQGTMRPLAASSQLLHRDHVRRDELTVIEIDRSNRASTNARRSENVALPAGPATATRILSARGPPITRGPFMPAQTSKRARAAVGRIRALPTPESHKIPRHHRFALPAFQFPHLQIF